MSNEINKFEKKEIELAILKRYYEDFERELKWEVEALQEDSENEDSYSEEYRSRRKYRIEVLKNLQAMFEKML